MATLTAYTLQDVQGGDYTLSLAFDDGTTSAQTIAFGPLADDPPDLEGGQTAAQKLTALVTDYAAAYQAGLVVEQTTAGTGATAPAAFSALMNKPQAVEAPLTEVAPADLAQAVV